jgi:hypothetical protein
MIAVRMSCKRKLSGYSGILLIILIGAAKKLKFVRDQRGGGRWRSLKRDEFWGQ